MKCYYRFLISILNIRNSKNFKKFKKISVDIGSIPADIKRDIIKKYLEKCSHINAANFFRYYAEFHPDFDSMEQVEKRERLAAELEKDLFENVKTEG